MLKNGTISSLQMDGAAGAAVLARIAIPRELIALHRVG